MRRFLCAHTQTLVALGRQPRGPRNPPEPLGSSARICTQEGQSADPSHRERVSFPTVDFFFFNQ